MKEFNYQFGEYKTKVIFAGNPRELLDHSDLAVFDENTWPVLKSMPRQRVILPPGEAHKNWESVDLILRTALDARLGRDARMVAVGGGVVCDMTAFAASLYMRGCELVLVPTTLLAMVDAALGGKTGIDYHGYKNLVGTFYPAQEIWISPEVLESLSDRDYRCGLAEVIKQAALGDAELLEILEKHPREILARDRGILDDVILRAFQVKADIVTRDLRESGERAHLNLGHTFAHALESVTGFSTWSHGEAVAWGMDRALDLGVRAGITDPAYGQRIRKLMLAYGFVLEAQADPRKLYQAMVLDKKKKDGRIRFIVQEGPQKTLIREFEEEEVLKVLNS